MATAATVDRSVRASAGQIQGLSARLGDLEAGIRTDQLGDSSIQNGFLSIYDDSGVVRAILGKQADGTYVGGNSINNPLPPPVPKAPTVASVLSGVKVTGNGSMTGSWPVDFARINVYAQDHASPTPALVGTLASDDDVLILAPLPAGSTWDVWLTSVNLSGTESTVSTIASGSPNQVVSTDLLDGIVTTLKLASGAVTTAKIAAAAVTTTNIAPNSITTPLLVAGSVQTATLAVDAVSAGKIAVDAVTAREILASSITSAELATNSVTATKIVAGSITASKLVADMVIASRIIAGTATGARVELHPTNGIQAFQSDGVTRTFWIDATTGNFTATGTISTGFSGTRIVLNNGGVELDTMRFYPSSGSVYATIQSTDDGTHNAAILIDGGDTGGGHGRLGAYNAEGFISFLDGSGSYSRTAVTCLTTDISIWAQGQIGFVKRSGSSSVGNSSGWILWANGTMTNCPVFGAANQDSGIKLDQSTACATNAIGSLFGPIKATAFTVSSGADSKVNIADMRALVNPLGAIGAARSKSWQYVNDVTRFGAAAPTRFGPIADDLPPSLVHQGVTADATGTEASVSLGDLIGTIWGALGQISDQRLVHCAAAVTPPAGLATTINATFDVVVPWNAAPTQTIPAVVSVVPQGPGPVQQRVVSVSIVATDVNGVTVRFSTARLMTGVLAFDPADRWVVHALFLYTPPYVGG